MSTVQKNAELLSALIGLSLPEALTFLSTHKILDKDPEDLTSNVLYCRRLGYADADLTRYPTLLKAPKVQLEQHYLSLEEGGFRDVPPMVLARANYYMRRRIDQLKGMELIGRDVDVPRCFLSYIGSPEVSKDVSGKEYPENETWCNVHFDILKAFLKRRLDADEDDLVRLFRVHRMIKYKSFRIIRENIEVAEGVGFDRRKILGCGYLLSNYPEYPKGILRDLSGVAGADWKRAFRHYPKLMMTSPRNVERIYGILKEFDVSDETIRKQMNVFGLSPGTLRMRLEAIRDSPDLRLLLGQPRLLSLIVHHNRARSRLAFLQALKVKCASFTVLGSGDRFAFQDYVREGKDVNRIQDVDHFLSANFPWSDTKSLRKRLKMHPFYLHVPIKDMTDTYEYLARNGFTQRDLAKVVWILLYPAEKVSRTLSGIHMDPDIDYKTLSQVQKLNLVLYLLEKNHHFTGNGIWDESTFREYERRTLE